jgi:hypothetical protein
MLPRTIFLSRLLGLYNVLVALSMVTHRHATVETITALIQNPPVLFIVSVIALSTGLAMVLSHNIWSGGALPIFVTLVGWIALVKGVLYLFLPPEASVGFFRRTHYEQFFYLYAAIILLVGVYLTYGGFRSRSRSETRQF